MEIANKEDDVVQAWKDLLERVRQRSHKLGQSDEYQRLHIHVQDLLLWIQDMRLQIESDDQPKYVILNPDLMFPRKSRTHISKFVVQSCVN